MSLLDRVATVVESEGAFGRHSLMLGSLVLLLVAMPIWRAFSSSGLPFSILLMIVMSISAYVNATRRWTFVLAALLGATAVVCLGIAESNPGESVSHDLRIAANALALTLFSWTTLLIFVSLLRSERVDTDTVVGGISVYLLIGMSFALAFSLVGSFMPEAFFEHGEAIAYPASDPSGMTVRLLYFSFVTLTTLGYGDITPGNEVAETLALAEAVIGQLYLAIFVARLVALYGVANRSDHDAESLPPPADRDDSP